MGSLLSGFSLSSCREEETPGREDGVTIGSEGSLDSMSLLANPPFSSLHAGLCSCKPASFLTA